MNKLLCALFVLCVALFTGCQNGGSAKAVHTEFGVTPLFKVKNDTTNISDTDKNFRVGDTETDIQILLFELKNKATGVRLAKPPAEKP